jgi:hypothetical protein
VVCWDRLTRRYPLRRVHPIEALHAALGLLEEILGCDLEVETVCMR